MQALWWVSRFPTEIEADLQREYGRRIAEWHRYPKRVNGSAMSSRELLSLIAHLSPESSFKIALGPDGWSDNQRVAASAANDLMRLLHTSHVAGGGESYDFQIFLSPLERHELAMEEAELDLTRDDFFERVYGSTND